MTEPDEARRRPPHHRDHGRGAGERRLLRRAARPADGQEDRQPGRPDRLPPLLRRRAGRAGLRHHLLRVPRAPRAAAPATAWSTRSAGGSPRPRRSTSGPSGSSDAGHSSPSATATRCASPTPRASRHELRVSTVDDPPLIADHPEVPKELALQGFDGVRAYASDPDAQRPAARRRSASSAATTAGRRAARAAAASAPTTSRPPSAGLQGAGTVHHVAWASKMDEHEGWRERVIAGGRAARRR